MKISLRLFVECANSSEAQEILAQLASVLSTFDLSLKSAPKQYWKIPTLFEFPYELSPGTRDDYEKIVKSCGTGWLHMDDKFEPCSVWNRSEQGMLFIDEVTWAEVMLLA
jgi:hypothetical protein